MIAAATGCFRIYIDSISFYGCTDPLATNYDSIALYDDGSCCYGSSANLQVYTNYQSGYAQYIGFELQDSLGNVIASGGNQAGEVWQDYTYYNYCLPINDSCSNYNLVLYDSWCSAWSYYSQASALVTSSTGDTLLYLEPSYICGSQSYSLTGASQGCTDPLANNYDPNAVCDDGSCCYGSSANLQVYTNYQCGYTSQYMGFELQDSLGNVIASGGNQAGEVWQDYTYYNYCLPINDSCSNYNLVLYDSWCRCVELL